MWAMRKNKHDIDTPRYTARSRRYDGHYGLYHDYGKPKHSIGLAACLAVLAGAVLLGLALLW